MKISIFGMGYVGAVCSACLAKTGNTIVAVDIDKVKLDLLDAGFSPISAQTLRT